MIDSDNVTLRVFNPGDDMHDEYVTVQVSVVPNNLVVGFFMGDGNDNYIFQFGDFREVFFAGGDTGASVFKLGKSLPRQVFELVN